MSRAPWILAALLVPLAALAPAGADAYGSPDPRDRGLAERARRVDRNTLSRHISPEGVLAYRHRPGATPDELSVDILPEDDTGIWTGAYAAAMACRWHATRDPEALLVCRRLAAGLDLLSRATGLEGCISRSVGRLAPGAAPGERIVSSPLGGGLCYRRDPSRDTLAGVTLGWWFLHKYVEDPEIRAYASRNLGAIARRLWDGKMKLRDADGRVTKYGVLEAKSGFVFENGPYAAIGLATILAGKAVDPCPELRSRVAKLREDGWVHALDAQYTWFGGHITTASNLNTVHMALLVLSTVGEPRVQKNAGRALRTLRDASRGWQNGGLLSMCLLSGHAPDRAAMVEERCADAHGHAPGRAGHDLRRTAPRRPGRPDLDAAERHVAVEGRVVPRPARARAGRPRPEANPHPRRLVLRLLARARRRRARSRRGAAAVAVGRREDAARPYRPSSRRPAATPRKPATRQTPTVVPT